MLQVADINSNTNGLNTWSDNVFHFSGTITAGQAAGSACDVLQLTGSATTGVITRLLKARFYLLGGGTATTTLADYITLNRVAVAPTGQTNVSVSGYPHALTSPPGVAGSTVPAIGSSLVITPSGSQTPGTVPLELGRGGFAVSLTSSGNDLLQVSPPLDFLCGPEFGSQPIEVGIGKFLTVRASKAIPTASALVFDIVISEATS